MLMAGAVRRDWSEEHNRGSLAETEGLCPECEARSAEWRRERAVAFDKYVAQINILAEQDGALDSTGKYCDPDAWVMAFEDGASPEEAWAEEKFCWYY